jgi:hypothetical protein
LKEEIVNTTEDPNKTFSEHEGASSFIDENSHLKILRDGMKSKGKKNGRKLVTIG